MDPALSVQEFRRHRAWCPHGRPAGRRRLDLATDYGAFPVWEWVRLPSRPGRPGQEAHAGVGPRYLGLSADLAAALRSWAAWHNRHQHAADVDVDEIPPTNDEDRRHWRAVGVTLAERLAAETGAEVVYRHTDGVVTDCPHCQLAG